VPVEFNMSEQVFENLTKSEILGLELRNKGLARKGARIFFNDVELEDRATFQSLDIRHGAYLRLMYDN